ncbi:unnamed protein product [Chrysoparadoxa australica]
MARSNLLFCWCVVARTQPWRAAAWLGGCHSPFNPTARAVGPARIRGVGTLSMGKGSERRKGMRRELLQGTGKAKGEKQLQKATAKEVLGLNNLSDAERDPESREGYVFLLDFCKKAAAPKRAFVAAEEAAEKGLMDHQLRVHAAKTVLDLSRGDLAKALLKDGGEDCESWLRSNPAEASGLVRACCKANDPTLGQQILEMSALKVPAKGEDQDAFREDHASFAASVYPNLCTAWLRDNNVAAAYAVLEDMARGKLGISTESANRLIQSLHKRRDLKGVFAVLDVMAAGKVEANDQTYEFVANAAVGKVDFVTGAVSMETLPTRWMPEAAFIGRSNVGKSSLINMLTNRKALAYTSKRPGKTQQFNYFAINDHGQDSPGSFYLVDMPGVGYAKVPDAQRKLWMQFFRSYVTGRASLRVLFHLIDGRHGPVGQDHTIMQMMKDVPTTARYVVVLTKADKTYNTVSKSVLQSVIKALKDADVSRTPIIITSATTKLGRDDMWRYLRLAAVDSLPK